MTRSALALLALATLGCGIGRSRMLGPRSVSPDAAVPVPPDGASLPDAVGTDRPSRTPDGWPGPDLAPPPPDLPLAPDRPPYVAPDVPNDRRPGDLPSDGLSPPSDAPPLLPDVRPKGPPPYTPDARLDGPLPIAPEVGREGPPSIPPEAGRDGPPLVTPDVPPEVSPPPSPDAQPDGRRRRPDSGPPPRDCTAGAACTADCTATCSAIGTMTCTCTDGVLACGACQMPPITVSPEPCPDNPSGTDCSANGLVCFALGNGSVAGACVCLARGSSGALRWSCIPR